MPHFAMKGLTGWVRRRTERFVNRQAASSMPQGAADHNLVVPDRPIEHPATGDASLMQLRSEIRTAEGKPLLPPPVEKSRDAAKKEKTEVSQGEAPPAPIDNLKQVSAGSVTSSI